MAATRRLAAVLAADMAGYSRLIGVDEQGTLDRLRTIRSEIVDPSVATHNGRIVKTTGDGFLAEFGSTVEALRCASDIQGQMPEHNAAIALDAISASGSSKSSPGRCAPTRSMWVSSGHAVSQ